jgi:hypothetical protein
VNAINTWTQIGSSFTAPIDAVSANLYLLAYQRVASSIGSVWFDEIHWDVSALFESIQSSGITSTFSAALTEGYFG